MVCVSIYDDEKLRPEKERRCRKEFGTLKCTGWRVLLVPIRLRIRRYNTQKRKQNEHGQQIFLFMAYGIGLVMERPIKGILKVCRAKVSFFFNSL